MSREAALLLAMRAGFALVMVIMIYHRARAATREPLDRRQEGWFILITLRAAGAALWVSVIAHLISPAAMAWSAVALPTWLRWVGVGPLAGAVALLAWTMRNLGPNLTDTVVTRREHTLVTRGPYRFVRHPFYDTLALLAVAMSLLAANWFMLVAGVVVFALLAVRVSTEEANLAARFGEPYRAWRDGTGRFVPKRR